ncbi:MAG: LolA-related protein, partial [Myxococcota bacterium]
RMEHAGRVMDLSESAMARGFVANFVVLWSGDLEALRDRYEVGFDATASGWEMTLRPRDANLGRVIETISLRGSSETLREIETREVDGDRTLMILEAVDRDHAFDAGELRRLFPASTLPAGGP